MLIVLQIGKQITGKALNRALIEELMYAGNLPVTPTPFSASRREVAARSNFLCLPASKRVGDCDY